jgi:manganese/iron transport system permease protein
LDHILFGNVLGVGPEDLWTAGIVSLVVSAVLLVKWRDFLLHSFDPAQAKASGLAVGFLHYGMLALLSLTVVATLKAAGIILAVALLISPGAIAFLLTKRFEYMMMISVAVTAFSMCFGLYISVFIDSAPAPTIVLVLTAIFIAVFIATQIRTARITTS